ncbi:MAG: type II toxin-antitoxin system RelE/ParE family toxin [Cytophagia bacterium]|nr:type II toxin-antitoxin system RelE/ParE family toxin [Cytophagia bacterium]
MILKIVWTDEAEESFDEIFQYLCRKWSLDVAQNFAQRVDDMIKVISEKPRIFKQSRTKLVYQALVSKQVSLFYLLKDENLILLSFWDNRQDPDKIDY